MSANFNYYLNRQGLRGRKGEKGDQGESVTVEVGQNTSNTFTLLITTVDGTFETPNLRGSLINTAGDGVFLKYDSDTDSIYLGSIPNATDETNGVVRYATDEEVEEGSGDGVVTADQLKDAIDENIYTIKVNAITPLQEATFTSQNYQGIVPDEENDTWAATRNIVCSEYLTSANLNFSGNYGGSLGVNSDKTGFNTGNIYIEYDYVMGKICGANDHGNMNNQPGFLIFGTKDADTFYPKYVVRYGKSYSGSSSNQLRTYIVNSITDDTHISVTPDVVYNPDEAVASSTETNMRGMIFGLSSEGSSVLLSGYVTYNVGVLCFANKATGISQDLLNSINCCRYYPAYNYDLGGSQLYPCYLEDIVYGEYKGVPATQAEAISTLRSVGQYYLSQDVKVRQLKLLYDTNTIGVNSSGKLYVKNLITVDDSLSTVSENPVQNKVITTSINSITGDISTLQTNVGNLQNTIDGGEV